MNRVQINYKSGQSMTVTCDEFTVSVNGGDRTFAWKNMLPRPLNLNVVEVESVWDLGPVEEVPK